METIFVSLIAIVMLVLSTLFIVNTSMDSAENISDALKSMDAQSSNVQATAIDASFITLQGQFIILSVANIGQKDLSGFDRWDVLVQAPAGAVTRLALSASSEPGAGEWAIERISLANGNPEVFDPGILNPDEQLMVLVNLGAPLQPGETVRLTVATGNGVTSQCLAIG